VTMFQYYFDELEVILSETFRVGVKQ